MLSINNSHNCKKLLNCHSKLRLKSYMFSYNNFASILLSFKWLSWVLSNCSIWGSTQHTKFGDGTWYSFPVQLRYPVLELKWNIPIRLESWLATTNHSPDGSNWKCLGVAPLVCCHIGFYEVIISIIQTRT